MPNHDKLYVEFSITPPPSLNKNDNNTNKNHARFYDTLLIPAVLGGPAYA